MIYFIIQEEEFVKIGRTTNDSEQRMADLQTGNPKKLKLWVCLPGGKEVEVFLHKFWKAIWVRGEWFRMGPELKDFVLDWVKFGDIGKAIEGMNDRIYLDYTTYVIDGSIWYINIKDQEEAIAQVISPVQFIINRAADNGIYI